MTALMNGLNDNSNRVPPNRVPPNRVPPNLVAPNMFTMWQRRSWRTVCPRWSSRQDVRHEQTFSADKRSRCGALW